MRCSCHSRVLHTCVLLAWLLGSSHFSSVRLSRKFIHHGKGSSSIDKGPSSVNEGSSSSTRSVFDALKAPALSDLTRKRSVHCNPPPKGKRRARGEGSSEPKSITVSQRVKEFPEECLEVTGAGKSKLFCKACRKELSLKKNIIVSHMYYNRNNMLE